MGSRSYYIYMLASHVGGTLSIGVTSDLIRRVAEHRSKISDGFTKRYGVTRLVYFEFSNRSSKRSIARSA